MRLDMSLYRKRKWWHSTSVFRSWFGATSDVSKRVDLISRFTFPTFFVVFLGDLLLFSIYYILFIFLKFWKKKIY